MPSSRRKRPSRKSALFDSYAAWIAAAVTVMAIGTASAQTTEPGFYERLAFDAADTDGDGFVNEAELARDAAAGFSALDQDRNDALRPDELETHDPADFARVDSNGDGLLTFSEVMANKTRGFQAGDKNGDGQHSFDEMVAQVRAEEGIP